MSEADLVAAAKPRPFASLLKPPLTETSSNSNNSSHTLALSTGVYPRSALPTLTAPRPELAARMAHLRETLCSIVKWLLNMTILAHTFPARSQALIRRSHALWG